MVAPPPVLTCRYPLYPCPRTHPGRRHPQLRSFCPRRVDYNPMNDGGRYSIRSPILSNPPPTRPTLSPPLTDPDDEQNDGDDASAVYCSPGVLSKIPAAIKVGQEASVVADDRYAISAQLLSAHRPSGPGLSLAPAPGPRWSSRWTRSVESAAPSDPLTGPAVVATILLLCGP